ncbi:uncharacterized protein CANTADRAFT_27653 [Suhomyces tanzawaensis NRRL Y-17324]|uniref:RRM domain-containing protein n=1 Tax=Suhomyces tanzawaensis NRRL Y-17324 TaxID=984487 RepID=A0A1E4SBP1_9ASCO|nr:uncharacterized protein CANTADRAFT_27653 [Suhomyces tanzawaensis NRRL Y-17324]ODV76919.1 hypothetical protein CANTADRAFT_27653 [Suhomyces tanzawaensis NRRL Y-17324]
MSDILEKSLDDIIGENKSNKRGSSSRRGGLARKNPSSRVNKPGRASRPPPTRNPRSSPNSGLPREIVSMAGSRPVLRVRNIHPELNGEDLSNLFGTISPVDFVKFDNKNDSIAYVCFQRDNARSNGEAIAKYDGKKAMGQLLGVESATSLAARIGSLPVRNQPRSAPARAPKPAKPKRAKPVKKSADDLDNELEAYMNANGGATGASEPVQTQPVGEVASSENGATNNGANEGDDDMNVD